MASVPPQVFLGTNARKAGVWLPIRSIPPRPPHLMRCKYPLHRFLKVYPTIAFKLYFQLLPLTLWRPRGYLIVEEMLEPRYPLCISMFVVDDTTLHNFVLSYWSPFGLRLLHSFNIHRTVSITRKLMLAMTQSSSSEEVVMTHQSPMK
jgi:hypothetical protein